MYQMKGDRGNEERLRKLLASAYRARDLFEPDRGWERRVADRIAGMGIPSRKPAFLPAFEHFLWKLAPATLATCAALTALLAWSGVWTGPDGLQLLSTYLEELPFWRIFGA
jgi:hypothetical protein